MPEPEQLTEVEVSQMTPDEISTALRNGQLQDLLGSDEQEDGAPVAPSAEADGEHAPIGGGDLGARAPSAALQPDIRDVAELRGMSPEQIVAARRAGRLDYLLGVRQ